MSSVERLTERLKRAEGFSSKIYTDPVSGKPHIGYGRNLEDVGIRLSEAELMLDIDVQNALMVAHRVVGIQHFKRLTPSAQDALTELAFILGEHGLGKFKRMLKWVKRMDMPKARTELLDSLMYRQIPGRTLEIANLLTRSEV